MNYITRERVHVDRIATAWAIRNFVDPEARFQFVPRTRDVRDMQGIPFDVRGAALTHRGGRCTFEVLLETYALDDPALERMGRIIHAADLPQDEPSTGLDHREAADLMGLLEEFRAGGGTVLIITHDLELVFEYALRVVVMRRGTIRLDLPTARVQEHFVEVSAAGVHLPQFMHLVAALALPPATNDVPAIGEAVLAGLGR